MNRVVRCPDCNMPLIPGSMSCIKCNKQFSEPIPKIAEPEPAEPPIVPISVTPTATPLKSAQKPQSKVLFATVLIAACLIAFVTFVITQSQADKRQALAQEQSYQQVLQDRAQLQQAPAPTPMPAPVVMTPAPSTPAPVIMTAPSPPPRVTTSQQGSTESSGNSSQQQQAEIPQPQQVDVSQQVNELNQRGMDAGRGVLSQIDSSHCQQDINTLQSCIAQLKQIDPDGKHGSMADEFETNQLPDLQRQLQTVKNREEEQKEFGGMNN